MDEATDSKEFQGVKPKTNPIVTKENLLKSPSKSKDDVCCICLGTIRNVCVAETCLHRFCLECLKRWSKVKNNCPLCKTKLETILHDIKSDSDYKRYVVAQAAALENKFVIRPEGPEEEPRRGVHSVSNRIRIYREGLWVQYPSVGRERVRLCNPAFYREREGLTHRLIPWVKRELKALEIPGRFVSFIIELLGQYEIMSRGFHSAVHRLLTHRTSHFQHEFNCFAHSVYDMIGYDNVTQNRYGSYQTRIGPPYLLNVEDEENDEDIHFINSESIEIDLTQEPNHMDEVSAGSSRSYDECVCNHGLEIVSSISSSSTDNSNQTMYSISSSFPQTPVIISSESDSVILSTPNPSHQKKKRKKSVSKRNEESSTTILNQEIENIVISSDDEEFGDSTNYKRKKSKSKQNSQFQSTSSSHNSRRRERKDHPSKIKSSKKN